MSNQKQPLRLDLKRSRLGLKFWITRIFILTLSVFLMLALLIRCTVRDTGGIVPTLVYYMTPLILLSLGFATIFILSWRTHWYRVSLVWFIFAVITGSLCWNSQFQQNQNLSDRNEFERQTVKIVFWNIGDRLWSMDAVLAELRNLNPDLIGLVEAGAETAELKQFWLDSFPDYPDQIVKNGFVCLSRIPVSDQSTGTLSEMGRYERLSLMLDHTSQDLWTVFLVDIKSDVFKSRKEGLFELASQVSQINNQPVLVLGDFNTPSDSAHFRPLRTYLKNSFEIAGAGYKATWPLPLPVLDLDSIWVNSQVDVLYSENRWTWVSDHRPVVSEVLTR